MNVGITRGLMIISLILLQIIFCNQKINIDRKVIQCNQKIDIKEFHKLKNFKTDVSLF